MSPPENGVVIRRDPASTGKADLNLAEFDFYRSGVALDKSSMAISMSSLFDQHYGNLCLNNVISYTDYCHTLNSNSDPDIGLAISTGTLFDKVVVFNRLHDTCCMDRIDKFLIDIYSEGSLLHTYSFLSKGSGLRNYTFVARVAPVNGIIIRRDPSVSSVSIINLAEIDLYDQGSAISKSLMYIHLSSIYFNKNNGNGPFPGDICINDNYMDFCHTQDSDSWLLLSSGSTTFDKVVITNRRSCCYDRIRGYRIERK